MTSNAVFRFSSGRCLVSTRGSVARASRALHQLALAESPPPSSTVEAVDSSSFYARRRQRKSQFAIGVREAERLALDTELGRRVQALVDSTVEQEPEDVYREEDLIAIYKDLLDLPKPVSRIDEQASDTRSRDEILQDLEIRLKGTLSADMSSQGQEGLAQKLRTRYGQQQEADNPLLEWKRSEHIHHRILAAVSELVHAAAGNPIFSASIQSITNSLNHSEVTPLFVEGSSTAPASPPPPPVPLGLLTAEEWESLLETSGQRGDLPAAEVTLGLMKRSNTSVFEDHLNIVLQQFAESGLVTESMSLLTRNASTDVSPSSYQRDQLVKAHIRAKDLTRTLSYLHSLEDANLAPPIKSYTRIINNLFAQRSTAAREHAWDLFAHMRYVAHPQPDAALYAAMIRSCARTEVTSGDPHRALDLLTEMREAEVEVTVEVYNAVILVCARSEKFLSHAFRLAKEMLDTHRDAYGQSAMRPDRHTFMALLEGAKRIGDLARTRWILTEIMFGPHGITINSDIMLHVLHCYAAYRPPLRKGDINSASESVASAPATPESMAFDALRNLTSLEVGTRGLAHLPPRTAEAVIAEAEVLFSRMVEEGRSGSSDTAQHPFANVQITASLINALLSVYYRHAPLEFGVSRFRSIFEEHSIERNAHSYMDILRRCAYPMSTAEREEVLGHAERIWKEWMVRVEDPKEVKPTGLNARSIERSYNSMIRVYANLRKTDAGLALVRAFIQRYPPSALWVPAPKPFDSPGASLETRLEAPRTLLRLISPVQRVDDRIPPLLTFRDVELLHSRLVDEDDFKNIGFLKAVCEAYVGALRRRRDLAMKQG